MPPVLATCRNYGPKAALISALFIASSAHAQTYNSTRNSDFLSEIGQCRQVSEETARLACFDAVASKLASAGEIAIVSREDVTRTQRSLFGFGAAMVNPFNRDGRAEEIQSISATLTSARDLGRGELILTLDDGSIWRGIDSTSPVISPRRQYPVTVRRAAMGSYMMKIGDNPPFRVRRQ